MASTASIGGLVSGLDTASLISQLMQIEAQPQTLLKSQLSATQADAAAYRDINTSFAALTAAAGALTQASAWTAATASSSSSTVTATASAGAATGSLTFTVNQVATAKSLLSTQQWTSTTAVPSPAPGSLTVTQGTTTTTISTGSGSLNDTIAAINKSNLGLVASAVKTAPNTYQLQVTANATGSASDFGITYGTTGDFSLVNQAADAKITVGGANGTGGFSVTSASNTFTDVMAGTSFTVSQKDTTATITVATDTTAITNAVQGLVTAANAVLTKITKYTDTSSASTSAAVLKGDFALASLASKVLTLVSSAVPTTDSTGKVTNSSSAAAGLQLTRDGALTFDATKFKTALAANPTLVQQLLGGQLGNGKDAMPGNADDNIAVDGIAARLQQLAQQASDATSGSLALLAKGQDTRATDLQKQIDAWDLRLAQRKDTLTAQFTAMETALSSLQGQSSWLSQQLNNLPGFSSSKSS